MLYLHAVSGEVNAQSRLRQLRRDLLCWQIDGPGAVHMTVQTEVLAVWITFQEESLHTAAGRACGQRSLLVSQDPLLSACSRTVPSRTRWSGRAGCPFAVLQTHHTRLVAFACCCLGGCRLEQQRGPNRALVYTVTEAVLASAADQSLNDGLVSCSCEHRHRGPAARLSSTCSTHDGALCNNATANLCCITNALLPCGGVKPGASCLRRG
jgi:hypothetical protein